MVKSPKPKPPQPPKPARPPKRQRSPKKSNSSFESSVRALQIPRASGTTPKTDQVQDPEARSCDESAAMARLLRALADKLDPPPATEGQ
jgi:hypothetical protein